MKKRLQPIIVIVLGLMLTGGAQAQTTPQKQQPPASPGGPAKPLAPDQLHTAAEQLMQADKYAEAIPLCRQALARNARDIQAHVDLGLCLQNLKRTDESITEFRAALAVNPNPLVYEYLAGALLEVHRWQEARTAYQRASEMIPGDPQPHLAIGETYLREGYYPAAIAAITDALGIAPTSPDVHAALGAAYEQAEDHEAALKEYDAALALNPHLSSALLGRAVTLAGLKRHDEAQALMKEIVAHNPKDADALGTFAIVLDSAHRYEDAIAQYRLALQLNQRDGTLWGNLGWSQYGAGRYTEALDSSGKALAIDSKLAYVRYNIGLINAVLDRWPQARKEYDAAISAGNLADLRSGIHDVENAIARSPGNPALKQALDYLTDAQWSGEVSASSAPTPDPSPKNRGGGMAPTPDPSPKNGGGGTGQ